MFYLSTPPNLERSALQSWLIIGFIEGSDVSFFLPIQMIQRLVPCQHT